MPANRIQISQSRYSNNVLEWGSGDKDKFYIAEVLRRARLSSQSVVHIDSLVISAILMPRDFPIHSLSRDRIEESLDMKTKLQMKQMYDAYKKRLGHGGAAWYMTITSDLATKMWNSFEILWGGEDSKETLFKLHRILRAYTAVILDSSDMRVKVISNKREFGIEASRAFRPGEYIYELVGLVPTDNLADHTNLSVVTPHVDQGEALEPRVLFGPICFINHHCVSHNVQYVPLHGCAFTILVTKPIEEGEELFADYGPGWFEEGECPCRSCISIST
ncbi:hypothetical protein L208DRAFT_1324861 [Tricholoma matsutake]|nr:hypothetical protein L208DRAFT_1324861 [Tricholoma matsutake 945]